MININKELFRRTAPKTKQELINKLSDKELLSTTPVTIARVIKQAGSGKKGSSNKNLRISRDRQTGNDWNSTIEAWFIYKKQIYIDFYVQFDNTDTNTDDTYGNFIKQGEYQGQIDDSDRYGNPRSYYFRYDESDKAKAIKALLLEYVNTKYSDKLKEEKL